MLHNKNYASFVVSLLIHKMGGGEGGAYIIFWQTGGHLIEGGAYSGKYTVGC